MLLLLTSGKRSEMRGEGRVSGVLGHRELTPQLELVLNEQVLKHAEILTLC